MYRVTLQDHALAWSQKANVPNIGDRIRIKVLPDLVYYMDVSTITQEEDPEWTVEVTGNLVDMSGYATISLLNGKMHIKIYDPSNERIYILYYDRVNGKDANNKDLYIVQELDTSLEIPADTAVPPFNPFDAQNGTQIEPDYDDLTPVQR